MLQDLIAIGNKQKKNPTLKLKKMEHLTKWKNILRLE